MNELDGHGYPTGYKRGLFEGKTILVIGGSGTIGMLIVEYLLTQKPHTLRIFSNDENSLYESEQKFKVRKNLRYLLGDIRDFERVKQATRNVDYVFNAAAIKHVPKAEYNPMEAVKTNIFGLENIIQACVENGVSKLLQISTDKATNPICIMGMTKAIGERLIQIRWSQNPTIKMVCVRLGNVWNSRGSIMELVKECQKQDKPIPITSFHMNRYFMQQEEVIDFIMLAFKEGGNGEIYIPKLKSVNIADIIRGEVGIDYPFKEIGIRKGEKLDEKLINDEELSKCRKDNSEKEKYWIIKNEDYWVIENERKI